MLFVVLVQDKLVQFSPRQLGSVKINSECETGIVVGPKTGTFSSCRNSLKFEGLKCLEDFIKITTVWPIYASKLVNDIDDGGEKMGIAGTISV